MTHDPYRPLGPGAGARGGSLEAKKEILVTSADDDPDRWENLHDGKRTLRWAVNQEGPRVIRFKVDGPIRLKDKLVIERPDVTLDGSGRPRLVIEDAPVVVRKTHDVILRHLRVRVGSRIRADVEAGRREKPQDGIRVEGSRDVVVDHCSVAWTWDEGVSVDKSERVTVQNCLIAEPLDDVDRNDPDHAYGSRALGRDVLFARNVYAFFRRRAPQIASAENGDAPPTRAYAVNNLVAGFVEEPTRVVGREGRPVEAVVLGNVYRNPDVERAPAAILVERDSKKTPVRLRLEGNRVEVRRGCFESVTERSPWLTVKGDLDLNTNGDEVDDVRAGDPPSLPLGVGDLLEVQRIPDVLLGEGPEGAGATPWDRDEVDRSFVRRIQDVWSVRRLDTLLVSKSPG